MEAPATSSHDAPRSVAFLGPAGTFTEEALRTQSDYAAAQLVPLGSFVDVLDAVQSGNVDLAFVPIENSIEGTVPTTLDSLVFEYDLLIQREVVLDIHIDLLGVLGTEISSVDQVVSIPHAAAQCRRYLARTLPGAELIAANSTAEAAQLVSQEGSTTKAALAPRQAARLYGLQVLEPSVEDHPDNQTRFVAVARKGIPAPTGHDRTSIVCFQHEDRPGSLHAILSEFAARAINLTKIESRPTKKGLGDYCFIIDLEGHVDDEVVADCLRDLHAELAGVKLLGSYPAAGATGPALRAEAAKAWREADEWIAGIRAEIRRDG